MSNQSQYPQINNRDWLLEQYITKKRTLEDIAREVGCTPAVVRRGLRRFGITTIRRIGFPGASHYPCLEDRDWLHQRYVVARRSAGDIAHEIGCSTATVTRALRRFGMAPVRPRDTPKPPQLDDRAWLATEIQTKPMRLIAEELGCSYSAVRAAVVAHGIKIPHRKTYRMTVDKSEAVKRGIAAKYPDGRRGPNAANWRGGRTKRGEYICLYAPDHPRAKAQGRSHVQEHILVMEKKLGRYLEPGERVEHDDGNKTNNHPDNLRLMESSGAHIRQHFGYGHETRQLRAENARLRATLEAHGIKFDDKTS